MSLQTVTIGLPEEMYRRIKQQSQLKQHSISEELTAMLAQALPSTELLPDELEQELAQLDLFTDDELWQAAQITTPAAQSGRMQELAEKQQYEGLTEVEKQEAQQLSRFFNRIMLVRAKTAVLLKQRGHDIANLGPASVIE